MVVLDRRLLKARTLELPIVKNFADLQIIKKNFGRMSLWQGLGIYIACLDVLLRGWRPGPDSNRRARICNPLDSHSPTEPWCKIERFNL